MIPYTIKIIIILINGLSKLNSLFKLIVNGKEKTLIIIVIINIDFILLIFSK